MGKRIDVGDDVKIVSIHEIKAYSENREEYVGKIGKVVKRLFPYVRYFSGDIKFPDKEKVTSFYRVKIKRV